MPGMRDQSAVARMIDGLNSGDDVDQPGIMVVDMFQEFVLGIRRTGNKSSTRMFYRLGNAMKKRLILRGVPAADGIGFVMDMSGRVIGM